MIFRGSTLMRSGCSTAWDVVWYEAHQAQDKTMVVVQLNGDPRKVGRPGLLAAIFGKKKISGRPQSLPRAAKVLKNVPTPEHALQEIFTYEQGHLEANATFIDIGDMGSSMFGGLCHYSTIPQFAEIACPSEIRKAANAFVSDISIRFLLGSAPRSMLDHARQAIDWYNATPRGCR